MLIPGSALNSFAIEASDGRIGTVSDFLFDDTTWKLRWMVVDIGAWLTGRKVLIHPSAMARVDYQQQELPVRLSKSQVEASPDIQRDQPVSRQIEANLHSYYGSDPLWGIDNPFGSYAGLVGAPPTLPAFQQDNELLDHARPAGHPDDGDPHLRSVAAVTGYHVHAVDGEIGHVENFLIDDATWDVRYLIIDTRNWWLGQHVLVSPFAVREVSWSGHEIRTDLTRDRIRASPPWNAAEAIDRAYEERLHGYYGWPGYAW